MRNTVAFVLGGGRGTRLLPLTEYRSKPAVPLAGKYRLIDIPLSNCINSSINRIYVLTQFLSVSLHRHIRQTYRFDPFSGGFVEILAAQQTMASGTDWYQGTADAVRKNMRYLEQSNIENVLILSGDQLYRMDYRDMLATHINSNADATIAAIPVDRQDAKSLGVMRLDDSGRVAGFLEKPQTDEEIDSVAMSPEWIEKQGIPSQGRECLASMGIYLFKRDVLLEVLRRTTYEDFGKEIFPASIRTKHVQVHMFDGYWEDIGTIRAFYDANLGLTRADSPFKLEDAAMPIYSRSRFLPPSILRGCKIENSIIADGCSIGTGTTIENSIIGLRCKVGNNVTIKNSVLMGADEIASPADLAHDAKLGQPSLGFGNDCHIEGAIIDKNCHFGTNVQIHPTQMEDAEVEPWCHVRDGIVVIGKDAKVPNGWKLGE
jgi:glucose-1-phosphate adenylyltransferase